MCTYEREVVSHGMQRSPRESRLVRQGLQAVCIDHGAQNDGVDRDKDIMDELNSIQFEHCQVHRIRRVGQANHSDKEQGVQQGGQQQHDALQWRGSRYGTSVA
eukprot:1756819-Amphidinium_carterae.2